MESSLEPLAAKAGERSNWDILSLLRFFLALIVAATHIKAYTPSPGFMGWLYALGPFEAILCFLLISGYSIGHSIKKEPHGFFLRRMWRIYPVYLAAMVVTWLVERNPPTAAFAGTILINLLFLGQAVTSASYIGVGWSLAVEVWFYALAPLFLRFRMRTLEVLIGLSFLCYAIYSVGRSLFHWPYYSGTIGGINLFCLVFIWLAGFYLAVSPTGPARPLRFAGCLLLGHLLLTLGIQLAYRMKHHDLHAFLADDVTDFIFHGALLLLVYGLFCGIIAHRFHLSILARKICRFFGDISYPFYLVHLPTFILVSSYTQSMPLLVLAAVALSTAIYYACDFYSRRRKLT